MKRLLNAALLGIWLMLPWAEQASAAPFRQASRAITALHQGLQAERTGQFTRAITLYCQAAKMGHPEGYFRVGRLLAIGPASLRNRRLANAHLAMAMRLGSQQAIRFYHPAVGNAPLGDRCGSGAARSLAPLIPPGQPFDVETYLANQSVAKRKLAVMIRKAALQHQVNPKLALAIAIAESNLDRTAQSTRQAQGVMQLIPQTQARFGVTRPFDAEQNIRGAMSYLKWLEGQFGQDWVRISAAYNAGEQAVIRYGGVPPYPETQEYVQRVLYYAGRPAP